MTTITIQNSKEFPITNFESARDLFVFLREKLSPVQIHLVDDDEIPQTILDSIEQAEKEGDNDIIDF
jgi:hypothetical protein